MFDLNLVQEKYSKMSDEELTQFAVLESWDLTNEAFMLLDAEFEKRNLPKDALEDTQMGKAVAEVTTQLNAEAEAVKAYSEEVMQYALNEKAGGKTNYEIYNSLVEGGVDAEFAFNVIKMFEEKSKALADDADTGIKAGWAILILGLILIFGAFNGNAPDRLIIYGSIIALTGLLRLAAENDQKKKYDTVIEMIEEEQNEKAKNE